MAQLGQFAAHRKFVQQSLASIQQHGCIGNGGSHEQPLACESVSGHRNAWLLPGTGHRQGIPISD